MAPARLLRSQRLKRTFSEYCCSGGGMRRLVFCSVLLLAACQGKTPPQKDWRAAAVESAEVKIRSDIADPHAQFSRVALTGDEAHGQTCGQVMASNGQPGRFIVYIDGDGPFIEGVGPSPMDHDEFASHWYNDCVSEGYSP
jgi:hypothetical protein